MSENIKKDKTKKILGYVTDFLFWVVGSLFYSAAVNVFSVPNNISLGGLTGIATLLKYSFGTPVGLMVFVMNIPLFIIAWKMIGVKFIVRTFIASSMTSAFIDIFAKYFPHYTGDRLLAAIFCGLFCGLGLAIIFVRDATTGGTDIVAKLVHIKRPNISIGRVILACDALVVISAGLVFRNFESMLYAAIAIFVTSRTVDYIIYGTGHGKMLLIVTKKADEISKEITSTMGRGVTILPVKGGYTGEEKSMLVCAIRSHEIAKINKIIKQTDENAFMIITEAGEILGEGFTKPVSNKKEK